MRKLMLVVLLAVISLSASSISTGCDGTADTFHERMQRYRAITEWQTRMFVDDWDEFWLMDRNNRGTMWHPRVGF